VEPLGFKYAFFAPRLSTVFYTIDHLTTTHSITGWCTDKKIGMGHSIINMDLCYVSHVVYAASETHLFRAWMRQSEGKIEIFRYCDNDKWLRVAGLSNNKKSTLCSMCVSEKWIVLLFGTDFALYDGAGWWGCSYANPHCPCFTRDHPVIIGDSLILFANQISHVDECETYDLHALTSGGSEHNACFAQCADSMRLIHAIIF
jgi:hypothetical protein